VTGAVEDLKGLTHAVVVPPEFRFDGVTACDVRFWTVLLGPSNWTLGSLAGWSQRMAESDGLVDCMTCLVRAAAYDEACTDGSPPTSETA
jgi:hypothetical protein